MTVELAPKVARIFEYPDSEYLCRLFELERSCCLSVPLVAKSVSSLCSALAPLTFQELQELYTRTFDLAPVCAPYLSVHLFGESSFKRARLMTGLAELYADRGVQCPAELPDHIGIALDALPSLEPNECVELLSHCLRPGLEKMGAELSRQNNPYSNAISAVEALVSHWLAHTEVSHG